MTIKSGRFYQLNYRRKYHFPVCVTGGMAAFASDSVPTVRFELTYALFLRQFPGLIRESGQVPVCEAAHPWSTGKPGV